VDLRQHLEEELAKDFKFLKDYEDRKRNTSDPRLISECDANIKRLTKEISERQQELNQLPRTYTSLSNQSFSEDLGYGVQLEMVFPGGTFLMGAPASEEGSRDFERPQHYVTVQPFYMGKYTITQEQWEKVVYSCPQVSEKLDLHPSYFKGDKLPVEQVSWYDAVEFCKRLAWKTGREYRLPSEAEWEYACRAGSAKPFSFADTITTDMVNYDGNYTYGNAPKGKYRVQTTPVGTFRSNDFGLYDMHGNVWEWCADKWHNSYAGAPDDGIAWLDKNVNRYLLRGGSRNSTPWDCRSAYRDNYGPGNRDNDIGFRVVVSAARTS
jgi:formylglycine-generating enzyme required for sulfatase activity